MAENKTNETCRRDIDNTGGSDSRTLQLLRCEP